MSNPISVASSGPLKKLPCSACVIPQIPYKSLLSFHPLGERGKNNLSDSTKKVSFRPFVLYSKNCQLRSHVDGSVQLIAMSINVRPPVVKNYFLILFTYLSGAFNMLKYKPFANTSVNTNAKHFLLETTLFLPSMGGAFNIISIL